MNRFLLILVFPFLLAGLASAAEREGDEPSAAIEAGRVPPRGPIFTVRAGALFEGGNGEGFKNGSDLGLALGYRLNPRWALDFSLSLQRGEGSPDITESAVGLRRAFREAGVRPHLRAALAGFSFHRPATPSATVNGVPVSWRPAKSVTYPGVNLGAGLETPIARGFSVSAGVSYHLVLEDSNYSGGNAIDYCSAGLALTFEPRGSGRR